VCLVVGLFTSEGCSSCPPADRWLSGLASAAAEGRVLPLAFHVDYWDYIGWKDPFAKPEYARRQRTLAAQQGLVAIYTPQVLLDSRDFRHWSNSRVFPQDGSVSPPVDAPATITLELVRNTASRWRANVRAHFKDRLMERGAFLHLALFENGLQSSIAAGENAGAKLRHDFVVRNWLGPFAVDEKGTIDASVDLRVAPDWQERNLGIGAIAYSEQGNVLQAVSLRFCGSP